MALAQDSLLNKNQKADILVHGFKTQKNVIQVIRCTPHWWNTKRLYIEGLVYTHT